MDSLNRRLRVEVRKLVPYCGEVRPPVEMIFQRLVQGEGTDGLPYLVTFFRLHLGTDLPKEVMDHLKSLGPDKNNPEILALLKKFQKARAMAAILGALEPFEKRGESHDRNHATYREPITGLPDDPPDSSRRRLCRSALSHRHGIQLRSAGHPRGTECNQRYDPSVRPRCSNLGRRNRRVHEEPPRPGKEDSGKGSQRGQGNARAREPA